MRVKRELHLSHPKITGITYRFCGHHDCPSGYAYGPTVRDEFIIHFVEKGAGLYRIDNKTHSVNSGSSFVLFPGYILHYQADKTDPWEYYWIALEGTAVNELLGHCGINPANPVIEHKQPEEIETMFKEIYTTASERTISADLQSMSIFYSILESISHDYSGRKEISGFAAKNEILDEHIKSALTYIHENYYEHDLSVDKLAQHIFLERSYFSTVFKHNVGVPPTHYIMKIRMENACRMLADSAMPIKKVAYSVGYREQGYFDKVFRKFNGTSPSEYRASIRSNDNDTDINLLEKSFFS